MKRTAIYAIALAAIIAAPVLGYAQTRGAATNTADRKMAASDEKFMKNVAQGGKAEVELGRLAKERGASDTVKQLGDRMMTDHAKAGEELAQLAQQKGVALPTDLDRAHQRTIDRLAKLSGAAFDREYLREMKRDHDKDVKEFRSEAKRAKDADLKAWVSKTLPTLEQHQEQVNQAVASAKGKASRT